MTEADGAPGGNLPPRRVLIVTGEASGDLLAANLIRAARQVAPELSFFGVGGSRMAAEGCTILIPGEELAVVGLVEVIGHFPAIHAAFRRLRKILTGPERPSLLVLVDFPDFNLRLAAQAKKAGVPVLYYVSPQVWAWRRSRVRQIARVVDRLATIFPFEPPYYEGLDLEVEYVGHPLMDEFEVGRDRDAFLREQGVDPAAPVVGLFPGSRESELKNIFDTILVAAMLIRQKKPQVRFLLPVAPSLDLESFRGKVEAAHLPVTLVRDRIYDTANACDAVITVSGTVTLQTALVGTPMVVLYKMSPLTYLLAKRLVQTPFISLANIVAGRGVVKELIQEEASPENVAGEILRILGDADYRRQMRDGLALVKQGMGERGSSARVAAMASEMSRGMLRSR